MALFGRLLRALREGKGPAKKGWGRGDSFPGEAGRPLAKSLEGKLGQIQRILANCDDVVYRRCQVLSRPAVLVYVDGLTDKKTLEQHVLKPLANPAGAGEGRAGAGITDFIFVTLSAHRVKETRYLDAAVAGLLEGEALLLVDGATSAYLIDARGFPKRNVEDAKNEMVVRGPRESFTETLTDNVALARRYVKDQRLKVRIKQVGSRTHTHVAVLFLEDLASPDLVQEVFRRLEAISLEGVLESHYLEELMRDHPWTPFPLLLNTERPDKVAGALLEGRIVLLTDRTPNALIVPSTFFDFFQTSEDYHYIFPVGTFFRWLRYLASLVTVFLPGIYIALLQVNPELFPTSLAMSVSGSRQGVPFTGWMELLLMDVTMEIFREATVRLPGTIGPSVGIVGGLVLGTAAVEAGLVSNIVVIIVAGTAISSFSVPSYTLASAFRLMRYFILIWSGLFGIFGLVIGFILVQLHLVHLHSFGVPYFTPLGPTRPGDFRDTLWRSPLWSFKRRPSFAASPRPRRLVQTWREDDEYE